MKLAIILTAYAIMMTASCCLLLPFIKRAAGGDRKGSVKCRIIIFVIAALGMLPVIGALLPDGPVCWFFQRWGNIFLGLCMYFFGTLFILSIVIIIIKLFKAVLGKKGKVLTGRLSSVTLIICMIASVALNVSGWHTSHDLKVTDYEIPMEELDIKEPCRIVMIADLHIGVNSVPGLYEDMVERINEQDTDLVLIAGDLVTSSFGAMGDPEGYAEIFSEIESKYGVYAVYGNHDVDEPLLGGFTFAEREDAKRNPGMEEWTENCGWVMLEDETVAIPELDGLIIAGRRDAAKPGDGIEEREDLGELLNGISDDECVILLQHEPEDLKELDTYGVDLSLSGHTHDGQMFPGNMVTRILSLQSYGLKKWGDGLSVVTSGVGYYGPPIRIGTISEITVLDIQ